MKRIQINIFFFIRLLFFCCVFNKKVLVICRRAYNPRGLLEVRQALENVNKVEDLLPIMKVRMENRNISRRKEIEKQKLCIN